MGTRGRIPKRKGAAGEGRPKMPPGTPPDVARVFRRLCATLPQLSGADEEMLLQMAQASVLGRRSFERMESDGLFQADRTHGGELRRHPGLLAWRTAGEVVRHCAGRLGGSVLDRQRLASPENDPGAALFDVLYGTEAQADEHRG